MEFNILWFLLKCTFLVIIVIYLFLIYVKKCFNYWKKRNISYFEPVLPAGNFNVTLKGEKNFGETVAALYFKAKQKSYNYVGIYLATKPILLLIDPDLVRKIFITYFSNFNGRGIPVNEKLDPMNAHLFNLSGEKWKRIRSKVAPLFSTAKMKGMFPLVLNNGKQLEEAIASSEGAIDVKDLSEKFTTDNIGSCVFGFQCNSFKNPNSEFRRYGRQYITESISNTFKITVSLVAPKILDIFRIPFVPAKASDYYSKIFNEVVKERIKTGENRKDFIDLFIQIQQNDNLDEGGEKVKNGVEKQVTFKELAATAFVFFMAGFETSSSTMNFCLYELAKHQDIQDKVRDEIKRILNDNNGELTYECLMQMNYTEQVIQETLRKYPTLPQISRCSDEDFNVPGTNLVIEKDLMIWIPVLGLHMDPHYFPEPEKFDPERFSEENKSKIYSGTYIPFGDGPRYCIGARFGQMQIKIGIAKCIEKYKYTIHEDCQPLEFDVNNALLTAKNKVLLKAHNIT